MFLINIHHPVLLNHFAIELTIQLINQTLDKSINQSGTHSVTLSLSHLVTQSRGLTKKPKPIKIIRPSIKMSPIPAPIAFLVLVRLLNPLPLPLKSSTSISQYPLQALLSSISHHQLQEREGESSLEPALKYLLNI